MLSLVLLFVAAVCIVFAILTQVKHVTFDQVKVAAAFTGYLVIAAFIVVTMGLIIVELF